MTDFGAGGFAGNFLTDRRLFDDLFGGGGFAKYFLSSCGFAYYLLILANGSRFLCGGSGAALFGETE